MLFIKRPTANPVKCAFVTPKRSDPNSLKVDKDKTLTIDYLSRAVDNFKDLPNHLQEDILSKCNEFYKILLKAYISSIRLYHIHYIGKHEWVPRQYNLQLPDVTKYLQNSYFVTESEEQQSALKARTNEHVKQFISNMFITHEKSIMDHAINNYECMIVTFHTYQEAVQNAVYCELHDLTNLEYKVKVLKATQASLNYVCVFAFPTAVDSCSSILEHILSKQISEGEEAQEMLCTLMLFEEEFLFRRLTPLQAVVSSEIKPLKDTPEAKLPQTPKPKKVSNIHITVLA